MPAVKNLKSKSDTKGHPELVSSHPELVSGSREMPKQVRHDISKKEFPIFSKNPELVYLDSAATSLKPQCVIDAVSKYYSEYSANVHRGLYDLSERATQAYEGARKDVMSFIKAKSEREIIFTRGATEAINLVAYAWGRKFLKSDDEIILSILEHHSNIVPWQQLAKEKGLRLKFLDCDECGVLKISELSKLLTRRTKLIAVTHVSNVFGTITPLTELTQKAHAIGAFVLVDGAQSVPHMPIDVQHMNCDFLVFSGHKMYGPTGIGALYAKEKILETMDPFMTGGDMIREVHTTHAKWNDVPWKFEAGTPAIAEAIGLGAAVRFLQNIGMSAVRAHEKKLTQFAIEKLKNIPGIQLFGPSDAEIQSSVISFGIAGVHPHDIAAILNESNIAIRAGHHCCMPLMEKLGISGTARISFGIYNNEEDIEKLAVGIEKIKKLFY